MRRLNRSVSRVSGVHAGESAALEYTISCSSRSDFRETESELLVTVCALTDIITQSVSARA